MIDPLILARGLHIAATVLAAGTLAFLVLVAEPAARAAIDLALLRRRLIALTWGALALAILSGAAWLLLFTADLTDEPGAVWTVLTETRFGLVALARLALAAALAVLIAWPHMRWPALAAAALLVALPGWIGHAGATPGLAGRVQLASDVVHLLAATAWLGGLPALALLLAHARAHARGQAGPAWRAFVRAATGRFGWLGVLCVIALAASGLFNAWNFLDGPRDLVTTDYGRLLLLKLLLFAAMLAIAAINRFHLTPRLAAPAALRTLQRTTWAEAGLGIGVLLLVGALGTLPPTAHRHATAPDAAPDTAFVHIHDAAAMADVALSPGRAGAASATIRVAREDGTELAAKEVRLALDPPSATAKSINETAERQPDGTWKVQRLEIGQPGIWTVRVTVTPSSGPQFVLDAPVVIER